MPTYEYRCDACGHEMEAVQRMADPRLTDCPHCGKSALQRLISGGFVNTGGAGGRAAPGVGGAPSAERILRMAGHDRHSKTCHHERAKQAAPKTKGEGG